MEKPLCKLYIQGVTVSCDYTSTCSSMISELILSMLGVCYSMDECKKSLQTQTYIHFVDFPDMCACTSHASWNFIRAVHKKSSIVTSYSNIAHFFAQPGRVDVHCRTF